MLGLGVGFGFGVGLGFGLGVGLGLGFTGQLGCVTGGVLGRVGAHHSHALAYQARSSQQNDG